MRSALVALALVLAAGVGLPPAPAGADHGHEGEVGMLVSAAWLAQAGGDRSVVVVDARPAEAYGQGHIPGAISLPAVELAQPNTDEEQVGPWQARVMESLGSRGIEAGNLVVSYDENGSLLAARVRWVLTHLGHERAAVLDGGLSAWTAIGQPTATEASERPATAYGGRPNPARLATWSYVLERLGDPNVQVLDVRPSAAYTGEAPGNALRRGHIPTAINLEWANNVQPQAPRYFKSVAELQALYDGIGLDRNKEIIVYCTTGIQSSNTLFVLDLLGYPDVRLYSGSWSEWGNREDLPYVTGSEPGPAPERAS